MFGSSKGSSISEGFSLLIKSQKKTPVSIFSLCRAQGSDLAPFGELSENEKLSEIKQPITLSPKITKFSVENNQIKKFVKIDLIFKNPTTKVILSALLHTALLWYH